LNDTTPPSSPPRRSSGWEPLDPLRRRVLAALLATIAVLSWPTAGVWGYMPPVGMFDGEAVTPYGPGDPLGAVQGWDAFVDTLWVFAAMLGWTVFLHRRARAEGRRLVVDRQLKPNHFLQAVFHVLIFTYWGIHWPDLRLLVPGILVQVLFGYWIDALLAWAIYGNWRLTVGPVAIVASTNLFLLYYGSAYRMNFVVFAIAFGSKYLARRDGVHVFNPSGIGMATVTVFWLVARSMPEVRSLSGIFGYLPTFDPFAVAPNMTEWLFLLALVHQLRFHFVLITLGGFFGFTLPFFVHDPTPPAFIDPPIFIALTFLITDPATTPRSAFGKLLLGVGYGFAVRGIDVGLTSFMAADDVPKILAVPLINLLNPQFDAVGRRLDDAFGLLLQPRYNAAHVAVWAVLGMIILSDGEGKTARHIDRATEATHFFSPWAEEHMGAYTCGPKQIWCRPFSFADEVRVLLTVPPRPYERRVPYLVPVQMHAPSTQAPPAEEP
jgi:hypothetical protein